MNNVPNKTQKAAKAMITVYMRVGEGLDVVSAMTTDDVNEAFGGVNNLRYQGFKAWAVYGEKQEEAR